MDVLLNTVQGQAAGGAAVVKAQEYGALMVWPAEFLAPLTVAV
jgi:hypothetical protein